MMLFLAPYEKQVAFLQNRQSAFRRAALDAKQRGDKAAALEYLRKMKGFDDMIEAAKGGLKVCYDDRSFITGFKAFYILS